MDIKKLVEDGARAICVEMGNDPDVDVSMSFNPTTPKPMWECFTNEARAVLAIALAALERDAIVEQRFGRTAIFLDELIENYRTLATQLGGKTDG